MSSNYMRTGDTRSLTSPEKPQMPCRFEVREKPVSLTGTLRGGERFKLMVITNEGRDNIDAKPVDCPMIAEPMFTMTVGMPGKYMIIPAEWPDCRHHYQSSINMREEGVQWIRN